MSKPEKHEERFKPFELPDVIPLNPNPINVGWWTKEDEDKALKTFIHTRRKLMYADPFYAVLAMGLQPKFATIPQVANGCWCAATNGEDFIITPSSWNELNEQEMLFVFKHEILHCVLRHPTRTATRNPVLWNLAIDFVVNGILAPHSKKDIPLEGVLWEERFVGKDADSVYLILQKEIPQKKKERKSNKKRNQPKLPSSCESEDGGSPSDSGKEGQEGTRNQSSSGSSSDGGGQSSNSQGMGQDQSEQGKQERREKGGNDDSSEDRSNPSSGSGEQQDQDGSQQGQSKNPFDSSGGDGEENDSGNQKRDGGSQDFKDTAKDEFGANPHSKTPDQDGSQQDQSKNPFDSSGDGEGESDSDNQKNGKGQNQQDVEDFREIARSQFGANPHSAAIDPMRDQDGNSMSGEQSDWVKNRIEGKWRNAIARARAVGGKSQGFFPAGLEDIVQREQTHRLPWERLLQQWVQRRVKIGFDWNRPNRRFLGDDIYMPSRGKPALGDVVVFVDTSGSVGDALLATFLGEIEGVLKTDPARVFLVAIDAEPTLIGTYENAYDFPLEIGIKGRGGTDFRPCVTWLEQHAGINSPESLMDEMPNVAIYLTDGMGTYPEELPEGLHMLWVLSINHEKGSHYYPPNGETIVAFENVD